MKVLSNIVLIFLLSLNCIADDKDFNAPPKEIKSEPNVVLNLENYSLPVKVENRMEQDTLDDKVTDFVSNSMLQAKLEVAMGKDILSKEEIGWLTSLIIILLIMILYYKRIGKV